MKRLANSKYCFVCGIKNTNGLKLVLESEMEGRVSGKISIPSKFEGWPGIIHGGILSAILDESAGRAIETEVYPKQTFLTGTLTVHFRHPAPSETPLLVEAELVRRKGRVAVAKSTIMDESRLVLAEAEGTFVQLVQEIGIDHTGMKDEWVMVEGEENENDHRISST